MPISKSDFHLNAQFQKQLQLSGNPSPNYHTIVQDLKKVYYLFNHYLIPSADRVI